MQSKRTAQARALRTYGRGQSSRKKELLLGSALVLLAASPAYAAEFTVNSEASLRSALVSADSGDTITFTNNIAITLAGGGDLPAITKNLAINGNGFTLDGSGSNRGLFVYAGTVAIADLTIANTLAQGGRSSYGGGGAGFGGGLFVAAGSNVTIANVAFSQTSAVGGSATTTPADGMGGGGLGGNSGSCCNGGGGGVGNMATGGAGGGGAGGAGIIIGAGSGGSAFGAGGANGGGGGGGNGVTGIKGSGGGGVGGGYGAGSTGGHGGFGGGGGYTDVISQQGGNGGFGGGGGGFGGNGGYGGGGAFAYPGYGVPGTVGQGGFGGGNGSDSFSSPRGGGGAGFGGAVFVMEGGTLTVAGSLTQSTGFVAGGAGMNAGQAAGSGFFMQGTGTLTFNPGVGQVQTIGNDIADEKGMVAATGYTPPAGFVPGSWGLQKIGAGTLTLSGANVYSGGTTISDGTLSVSQDSNLGAPSGDITFNGGTLLATNSFASARSVRLQSGNGTVNVDSTIILTLSGPVSGSGKLIKDGFGTLRLTGANTYTGGTQVDQGILRAEANGALGSGPVLVNGGLLSFKNAGAGTLSITTTNAGSVYFEGNANAGSASLVTQGGGPSSRSGVIFYSGSNAGSATFINKAYGSVAFDSGSSAGNAVITNEAGGTTYFTGSSKADTATVINKAGGNLDISAHNDQLVLGTLIGDGSVFLGATNLVLGSNGRDSTLGGGFFDGGYAGGSGGELIKVGAGTLRLTGESTYTGLTEVRAGTLRVDGSLASEVLVLTGATLSGIGEVGGIGIYGGATVAPGNSIGTLTVAGDVAFAPGSIYQAEVNAAGQSDRIDAEGKAILAGGTVQVLAESGSYDLSTQYTILRAQKGVIGSFAEATSDLAFLTPSLGYDADSVTLTMMRKTDPQPPTPPVPVPLAFHSVAVGANQYRTADAIEALGAGNRLFHAVIGQNVRGARQAFDALSGEAHGGIAATAFGDAALVQSSVMDHLRQPFGTVSTVQAAYAADKAGAPTAPVSIPIATFDPRRLALWGEGFGSWGKSRSDGNAASLDRSTGGFLLGADMALDPTYRVGIAGGFTRSTFDIAARNSSGTTESVFGVLYGSGQWGPLGLRLSASYTGHDFDTSRTIIFPGFSDQTSASYGGSTLQAMGEIGYRLHAGSVQFEPFLGASILRLHTNSFQESGGASILTGHAQTRELGTTTLGLRAQASFGEAADFTLRGMLGWRHAYGDVTPSSLVAFSSGAVPFLVSGVPVDRDALVAQAGLDWQASRDVTLGISYNGQIGQRGQDHTLNGNFTWRF